LPPLDALLLQEANERVKKSCFAMECAADISAPEDFPLIPSECRMHCANRENGGTGTEGGKGDMDRHQVVKGNDN
jgi:hypothetical protein